MTERGVDRLLLDARQLRDRLPNVDPVALYAAVHQPGSGLATDSQALGAAYLEVASSADGNTGVNGSSARRSKRAASPATPRD